MKLHIAEGLSLPLDAITRTFGIFGQRGTGKSTTAAVLVEQAVKAGGRVVALDPTGVWFGLTREGSGPGLPGVVLGGENQDAPLQPQSGALVAEFVMRSEYPFVALDMKLMRKHERQHFAMEFLEALYHENRDPLMVVFDEAAQFAPQQMREKGDVPRLLGAVEDLVKLGRSRGLGAVMIEQRIATLNANVREQIETLVAHRLVGPLDRKALREWIAAQGEPDREAEALAEIPKLQTRHALVWSPSFLRFFGRVAVNNATTFDSRATPEVGKRRRTPTARAPVDLAELQERMAATIEEAKANDPKALRAQVAALQKQLAAAEKAKPVAAAPAPKRVEVPAVPEKAIARLEAWSRQHLEAVAKLEDLRAKLPDLVRPVGDGLAAATKARISVAVAPRVLTPVRPVGSVVVRRTVDVRVPDSHSAPTEALTGPEQRILDALAWLEANGNASPELAAVAFLAGYKIGGGAFNNPRGRLRVRGLVDYTADGMVLTPAGRALSRAPEAALTNAEMQARVMDRLDGPMQKILGVLIDSHPDAISKDELAQRAGYEPGGGAFNNPTGRLRTLGLIDYPQRGMVVARDVLFPESA